MVLAAGAGRRLLPLTEDLPKTLLPVDGEDTILDIALSNLASVGMTEVVVISGYAAHALEERRDALAERHGVEISLIFNDKAEIWNNAYSLWLARERFADGVLLVNGDTVHPASVEESLLEARGQGHVLLATDQEKPLAEEEMKVLLGPDGQLQRINKALDPASSAGEYIGVTLIEPEAAGPLADALKTTWERDPDLYYEDGYQELADRGGSVVGVPIGTVEWVEVDNHDDLARARDIRCRS